MNDKAAFEVLLSAWKITYSVLIRRQRLNPTVECILLSERMEESSCSYCQQNLLYLD